MQDLSATRALGDLVAAVPAASRVLWRHHIDFCCGGKRSLRDAYRAGGLDADRLLDEIRAEAASAEGPEVRWSERPLPELVEHILKRYHEPLREELPRLLAMARRVATSHASERNEELAGVLTELDRELREHIHLENNVLFPGALADAEPEPWS